MKKGHRNEKGRSEAEVQETITTIIGVIMFSSGNRL